MKASLRARACLVAVLSSRQPKMADAVTQGKGSPEDLVVAKSPVKEVQLGFVEDFARSDCGSPGSEEDEDSRDYLLPEFLPSKVGGKPSWIGGLIPELDEKARACPACAEPMPLLLQVYAPLDHINADAYHRMILLLSCPTASCHHRKDSAPYVSPPLEQRWASHC